MRIEAATVLTRQFCSGFVQPISMVLDVCELPIVLVINSFHGTKKVTRYRFSGDHSTTIYSVPLMCQDCSRCWGLGHGHIPSTQWASVPTDSFSRIPLIG